MTKAKNIMLNRYNFMEKMLIHDRPTIILGFTWSDTVSIFWNHPACSVTKIMWLSRAYSIVAIVYIVLSVVCIQYSLTSSKRDVGHI